VLDAGRCLDVFVVPGEEVAHVEVAVLDGRGRVLGRAPTDDEAPAVVICGESRADVTIELRPRAGRGVAAIVMSAIEEPVSRDAPGFVRVPATTATLDDAVRTLGERLPRSSGAAVKTVRGDGVVGRRASFDVEVPAGCARVDLVTGAPAQGVDVWLWSSSGALAAHADGGSRATLFGCTRGAARLDVEATEHSGPFAFELRPLALPAKPFATQPLAASRVLSRFFDADRLSNPKDIGIPRSVALSPDALAAEEITIPPGRCVDAALGLGPGAEGAELRLVAAGDRRELARARGAYSALAATCAATGEPPLRVTIELRTAAGTTTALLGLHVREEAVQDRAREQDRQKPGASAEAELSAPGGPASER
jgi:hypothetical protein